MRRILLILTLLLTLVCLPAAAQTDAQFSQYYEVITRLPWAAPTSSASTAADACSGWA